MSVPPVSFVAPLRRSVKRSARMLFRPFDPGRWLTLAFAGFLSYLGTAWIGGAGFRDAGGFDLDPARSPAETLRDLFIARPYLLGFLGLAAGIGLVLWVLFLWIGSRGRFVFLDDVVRERAAVVEPWHRFRRPGNSLFLWRLAFGVGLLVALLALLGPPLALSGLLAAWKGTAPLAVLGFFGWALLASLFALAIGCTLLVLDNFVVPLMYRDNLTTTEAWRALFPLLRAYPVDFLTFAAVVLGLALAVGLTLLTFGFLTCCVGFALVAVPFVGMVVLLPLWIAYRSYGPEFLAQYGERWSVFAAVDGAPPPSPDVEY